MFQNNLVPGLVGAQIYFNMGEFVALNMGITPTCPQHAGSPTYIGWGMNIHVGDETRPKNNAEYVTLSPKINILTRKIEIDNTSIQSKYRNFLLNDGKYELIYLGAGMTAEAWKYQYGARCVFSEDMFMPIMLYNPMNPFQQVTAMPVVGCWNTTNDTIIVIANVLLTQGKLGTELRNLLKEGKLAITSVNKKLNWQGCILQRV